MKLVTVSGMKAIEEEADASGLTYPMMMENAGHNLSREVLQLSYTRDDDEDIQVLGLVGPGNNGGDTLVALAHLAEKGWKARAYLVKRKVGADPLVKRLEEADGEIYSAEKDLEFQQLSAFIETADVILDGVLGTGFKLPLKADIGKVLEAVNKIIVSLDWPPLVIAVDCPSGVDCDSGEMADVSLAADATVTMAAVKQGLLKLPAFDIVGEIRVVEIGNLEELKSWKIIKDEVADEFLAKSLIPNRPSDSHKGSFGTAIIVAGSINYTGAALLAGKAAYRIGTGLVELGVASALHMSLAGQLPEATWILLPQELGVIASSAAEVLLSNLDKCDALLIGPGLGMEDTTREFIKNLLDVTASKPSHGRMGFVQSGSTEKANAKAQVLPNLVIDADGLKLLAKINDWFKLIPPLSILTPHPGEMAILTGLSIEEIQKDRQNIACKFAKKWGHIVILKGAFTIIASPDGRSTTIPIGTPALARAGTGDVLAGIIVGLRAQGLEAYDAGRLGAWVHAQAGLVAAQVQGGSASVMAGDVVEAIADVLSSMN